MARDVLEKVLTGVRSMGPDQTQPDTNPRKTRTNGSYYCYYQLDLSFAAKVKYEEVPRMGH